MTFVEPASILAAAVLLSVCLTPAAVRLARRVGAMDHPGGRKIHAAATPLLGGVAIALAVVVPSAPLIGWHGRPVAALVAALALGAVGLWDDLHPTAPFLRLAAQAAIAAALWAVGVRVALLQWAPADALLSIMWFVGVVNAVNMVDNHDGVAAGVVAGSSLAIAAIGAGTAHDGAIVALAAAGASLGFLVWNRPRAKVFMGDAGSMFLGTLMAVLPLIVLRTASLPGSRVVASVLLVAVPLVDLSVVVIARLREGRGVTRAATDHVAQRLGVAGWTAGGIVILLSVGNALVATAAVVLVRSHSAVLAWTSAVVVVAMWVSVVATLLRLPTMAAESSSSRDRIRRTTAALRRSGTA